MSQPAFPRWEGRPGISPPRLPLNENLPRDIPREVSPNSNRYWDFVSAAATGGDLSSADDRAPGISSKCRSCWARSRGNIWRMAPALLS